MSESEHCFEPTGPQRQRRSQPGMRLVDSSLPREHDSAIEVGFRQERMRCDYPIVCRDRFGKSSPPCESVGIGLGCASAAHSILFVVDPQISHGLPKRPSFPQCNAPFGSVGGTVGAGEA